MNPIIRRELLAALRSQKSVVLLTAVAVVFSLLVIFRWPAGDQVDLSGALSQQVFRVFGYGLLTTLVLMAPAFPATSIVRERTQGTLLLLLNSPMPVSRIYIGKFFGVSGFVLLVLITSLPGAAACFAMGGISLSSGLFALYSVLLLVVLEYTTVALFISSLAKSSDTALKNTYLLVLFIVVVSLGPHYFLQGQAGSLAVFADWLRNLSPVPAVMQVLGQTDVGSQGLISSSGAVWRFTLLSLGVSLAAIGLTVSRLNYRIFDRTRSQGMITNEQELSTRVARRFLYLVDPNRRKAGIPMFVNPVLVKEFRCRRFGRLHWLLRMVFLCAILSLGLTVVATTGTISWDVKTIGSILVVLQSALIVLITPSLASGLISGERESGGWELLQMTSLGGVRIITGKLMSVVWPVLLILCATLPGYGVMYWIDRTLKDQIIQVLNCQLLTALLAVSVGAAVSSLFRRTAVATTVAYALLLTICAGTMLVWVARDAPFGPRIVEAVLRWNPVAAALAVNETSGFETYSLIPQAWWISGALSAVLLVIFGVQSWRLARPQ